MMLGIRYENILDNCFFSKKNHPHFYFTLCRHNFIVSNKIEIHPLDFLENCKKAKICWSLYRRGFSYVSISLRFNLNHERISFEIPTTVILVNEKKSTIMEPHKNFSLILNCVSTQMTIKAENLYFDEFE
jgi:hypothetical protein